MNVDLSVLSRAGGKWIFRVRFVNNSGEPVALPVDTIKQHGARTGLRFFPRDAAIEPLDKVGVKPKFMHPEIAVQGNQEAVFDLDANIKEKAPGVSLLAFMSATYSVAVGETYQVQFSWQDMKSNVVDWSIA